MKNARLPLEFAILDISLHDATPALSYFDKQEGKWTVKPAMRERLDALANRQWLDANGRLHEVTTFRHDVKTDGRHAEVEFGASLEEDLARRDDAPRPDGDARADRARSGPAAAPGWCGLACEPGCV